MARLEIRVFGSKKHLLVIPSKSELPLIKKALGYTSLKTPIPMPVKCALVLDDFYWPYLRIEK